MGGGGGRLTASQLGSVETPSTPDYDRRVSERRVPNTGGGESEWGSPLVPRWRIKYIMLIYM